MCNIQVKQIQYGKHSKHIEGRELCLQQTTHAIKLITLQLTS